MPGVLGGQKKTLDPMGWELWTVMSPCTGAGN